MFAILLSAVNALLAYVIRSVIVKFVIFFAIYFVVAEFIPILAGLIAVDSSQLNNLFANIPEGVWYFWDLFALGFGFSALIAAWVTRFIIRRIPLVG